MTATLVAFSAHAFATAFAVHGLSLFLAQFAIAICIGARKSFGFAFGTGGFHLGLGQFAVAIPIHLGKTLCTFGCPIFRGKLAIAIHIHLGKAAVKGSR